MTLFSGGRERPGGTGFKKEPWIATIIDFFHNNIAEQFSLNELVDVVQCGSYRQDSPTRATLPESLNSGLGLLREYTKNKGCSGK
jgi:hypothetical protein